MSFYTTGELAKLCDVSVRTVQYYHSRDILVPSSLTEGGRRLYSEEDLTKLHVICQLRELGVSIENIREILKEEDACEVIELVFEQQELQLHSEIRQRQQQLERLTALRQGLRSWPEVSVNAIGDIAYVMKNRKKMRKVYALMLGVGILMDVIEWSTLLLWIFRGIWWPFAAGMPLVLAGVAWMIGYYYQRAVYICPKCHQIFRPKVKEFLFANHTLRTRKLTCAHCGHHGFCVETYREEEA